MTFSLPPTPRKIFSDLQNFSTRNSPSLFPYLVKLNDNGSYHGLREPLRKQENHYPELKIYTCITTVNIIGVYLITLQHLLPRKFKPTSYLIFSSLESIILVEDCQILVFVHWLSKFKDTMNLFGLSFILYVLKIIIIWFWLLE